MDSQSPFPLGLCCATSLSKIGIKGAVWHKSLIVVEMNLINSFKYENYKTMATSPNSSSVEDSQFFEKFTYCKLEVKDGDPSIDCDECFSWAHLKCSKLPEAALSVIDGQRCCWFCNRCRGTVKKIIKDIVEPLSATKKSESLSKNPQNKSANSICHVKEIRVSG